MIYEGLGSGVRDLVRLKWEGEAPRASGMNETIETEMNMVFLCDLEENSPSGAEDACWVTRLHKLLTFSF